MGYRISSTFLALLAFGLTVTADSDLEGSILKKVKNPKDYLEVPKPRNGQVDYTIKLVGCKGTESSYAGRLEILYMGQWGTICGNEPFNNKAASVACHSLGYQRGRAIFVHNEYGGPVNKRIVLNQVNCSGTETHLDGCEHPPFQSGGISICTHEQDAYVACEAFKYEDGTDIQGYEVKLCNNDYNCSTSSGERQGLLLIKYNDIWGTVCGSDLTFDSRSQDVACKGVIRGLNESFYEVYGEYLFSPPNYIVSDDVPIWMGSVGCDGTEKNLGSCPHPAWGVDTCHHYNDVWLKCSVRPRNGGRTLTEEEVDELLKETKMKNQQRKRR